MKLLKATQNFDYLRRCEDDDKEQQDFSEERCHQVLNDLRMYDLYKLKFLSISS